MGERFSLLYRYSIDKMKTWTDFTDIVDSSKTKVTWQLCSTECKSIKDKASITLPSQDSELKTDFIKAMLEEYEIYVQIFDLEPLAMKWEGDAMMWENREMLWKFSSAIFTGVVDKKSSTTIKSFPFTPSVTLSLQDLSSLKLDDNVDSYVFLEDSDSDKLTVTKIIKHLLDLAGCSYTADSIKASEEIVLPCFVIDKDNAKTYREYIDTLLFEVGGYVLDFDEYGKAKIVRLPWDDSDKDHARTIDNPTIADGVSTKIDILSEDGIKLTWSTLAESSKDQIVYQDSISRSVEDGVLKGVEIPNEGYWPEDGDITATYQEFSADFLDKPYLYQDSRKRNEDLSIIIVRDVYATIQATDAQNQEFSNWEYPVLPSLGMKKNPTIYPTKAWYLLRNNSGNTVDLQFFTLRGRVLYRSAVNEETTPLTASKPKEYTSTYIYTKAHAKQFSQFYWHYLNTTRYVTTYTEINRGYLGETVRINHKGVEYGQDAMVVSQEITWLNRKTKKITATAIAVSAYNEYESSSTSKIPGRKEKGNSIEKVENAYCVTQTQTKPNAEDITLPTPPKMSAINKYLWQKTTITYTDPSFPPTTTITLVSVYGDDGKPALVCSITCDKSHVTRNDRRSDSVDYLFTIDVQGYTEKYTVYIDNIDKTSSIVDGKLVINKYYKKATAMTAEIRIGDNVMSSITLDVIDETGGAIYLGELATLPQITPSGGLLIDGDYFIASDDFTVDDVSYSKGVPYVYKNGSWSAIQASDKNYSEKMLQCLGGALQSGIAVPSSTALYGWFNNLVAQNAVFATLASNEAFIKLLKVYSLFVGTGSRTSGFYVEIADHQEGSSTEEILFNVWFDGTKVFSIDPTTGNVYIGTGFFYQASDHSIRSTSGKVVINANGVLEAENALLDGAVVNGTVNASSGLFQGSIDSPAFSSKPNTSGGTTATAQLPSDKQGQYDAITTLWSNNGLDADVMYSVAVSSDSSIKWVQYYSSYSGGRSGNYKYQFFNGSLAKVGEIGYSWYTPQFGSTQREYTSSFEGSSPSLSITYGQGEIFKFKNLPTAVTGLQSGQVYSDNGTLKIVT